MEKQRRRRGQIIELDATTFRIRVPLKRNKHGARSYHNETLYQSTRAKAEKRVTNILASVDNGTYFTPSGKTFSEIASDWLLQKRRDAIRETTIATYQDYLKLYVNPFIGSLPIGEITPLDVRDLYNDLQDKGLSKNTIRQAQKILETVFEQSVLWKAIKENPSNGIHPPRNNKNCGRAGKSLTREEAQLVIDIGMQELKYLIFAFALITGMRPSEYLGLRWQNLSVEQIEDETNYTERGLVKVRENAVFVHGVGWTFTEPKTKKAVRDIYFPSSIYYKLSDWRGRVERMRRMAGKEWKEHGLIFPTRCGFPQLRPALLVKLRGMLREAGIDETHTLYSLRYSHATLSLVAGVSDKVVSDRMGHTKVDFTKDVYMKVLPEMARSNCDKLEEMFFPTRTTLAQSDNEPIM